MEGTAKPTVERGIGRSEVVLMIVLAVVVGLAGLWFGLRLMGDRVQARGPAQATSSRVDSLYVTVRGRGLHGEGWQHNAATQARKDTVPGFVIGKRNFQGKRQTGMSVGTTPDLLQRVWMDSASVHEGKLFRIHVDRPQATPDPGRGQEVGGRDALTEEADCADRILVIGLYSELWGEDAVMDQRYECRECGRITVCGSNPQCY
jgi:hypothetical protein